jgi:hypothetical protein
VEAADPGAVIDRMRRILPAADRPIAVALAAVLLYGLYLVVRLNAHEWDPSRFIVAGDAWVEAGATPSDIIVLPDSVGYDGEFYYRLALDPLPEERTKFGVTLDTPAYRNQRILYPVAARLLALGNARLIPWTLIATNLLAIGAVGYFAGWLAKELGNHSSLGLGIALYPGLLLSLTRDLTEPLSLALILASLAALRRSRPKLATLLLVLAVLTRETALLVAVAAGVIFLASRLLGKPSPSRIKIPWFYFTVPACVFVGWQVFLYLVWGSLPISYGASSNRDLPFKGILDGYGFATGHAIGLPTLWLLEVGFLLALWFVALVILRRSEANPLEKVALAIFALGALALDEGVWRSDWAFLRVAGEATAFAFIVLFGSSSRLKLPFAAATAIFWAGLAYLAFPS